MAIGLMLPCTAAPASARLADSLRIVKANSLKRQALTNPIHEEENAYRAQSGDLLIMLAQYEMTIRKAFKNNEQTEKQPA